MFKRLLISAVALSVLLACYAVYVRMFSQLSRYPNLEPDELPPPLAAHPPSSEDTEPQPDVAHLLAVEAFGNDSWQADADIALTWSQSGITIYTSEYEKVGPKALRLSPFSLIYAEAARNGETKAQIVSLQSDQAVLEFDHPIEVIQGEGVRPVGGMVTGNVQIHADQGTEDLSDDIAAYTDSLTFRQLEKKIWTEAAVRMVAQETVLTGQGAELHLKLQDARERSSARRKFDGVSQFLLLKDVEITMLLEPGNATALGHSSVNRRSHAEQSTGKTPVTVTCAGTFAYDIDTSEARFAQEVRLSRITGTGQSDQLFCDDLSVFFDQEKPSDSAANTSAQARRLRFREAIATGRSVRVQSDAQNFQVAGTEMRHDVATGQTLMRGDPEVVGMQGGNVIHAAEIEFSTDTDKHRIAQAKGPGTIEVRDRQSHAMTLQASWRGSLRLSPQADQQLLVFEDSVVIEQPERGTLAADQVRVWLASQEPSGPEGDEPESSTDKEPDWQPTRIEAIGHVVADTDQFDIHASDRLDLHFEDGASAIQDGAGKANQTASGSAGLLAGSPGRSNATASPKRTLKRPPAQLHARTVRVAILRDGTQTELAEVWTDGGIRLVQPPNDAGADSVLIEGERLHVKRIGDGNLLEVAGGPAIVQLEGLTVHGDTVAVEQTRGIAWVEGKGKMILPVATGFDGKRLPEPGHLTIDWGSNMFFDGGVAEFGGGVEARQGSSMLSCRRLEAFLTERINFAEARRTGQKAQIEKLICTDAVQLQVRESDGDRLKKLEQFECRSMTFNNGSGELTATGPGLVRTYTRGAGALDAARSNDRVEIVSRKPSGDPQNSDQLHLTEVRFSHHMEGNRTQELAKFFGHVELFHAPVRDETESVNPNRLPPRGMRLACQQLQVAAQQGPGNQSFHEMVGTGDVDVEAKEFIGRGDRISYNQQHDRIIFEGSRGSPATLYRQKRLGLKPDEFKGEKIWYYRREDRVNVENASQLDFIELEADKKHQDIFRK